MIAQEPSEYNKQRKTIMIHMHKLFFAGASVRLFWLAFILLGGILTTQKSFVLAAPPSAPQNSTAAHKKPKELISNTVDGIVKIVAEHPDESQSTIRREKLYNLIEPHFDFKEMSKRSLGSYWNNITAAQQAEFVDIFSDLLSRTYLSYLETVKPGMLKVLSEEIKPSTTTGSFAVAVVKTDVKHKGEIFPIHYKLVERSAGWKVYDIVIENIGLVSNYRSEFAGVLRKSGFDGLIEKLKAKEKKK